MPHEPLTTQEIEEAARLVQIARTWDISRLTPHVRAFVAIMMLRVPRALDELKRLRAPSTDNPPCGQCGGPHPFDTTVPSVVWNAMIRARGLPEHLCLTCIVATFASRGESFTAKLIGGPFPDGISLDARLGPDEDQKERDAAKCAKAIRRKFPLAFGEGERTW